LSNLNLKKKTLYHGICWLSFLHTQQQQQPHDNYWMIMKYDMGHYCDICLKGPGIPPHFFQLGCEGGTQKSKRLWQG